MTVFGAGTLIGGPLAGWLSDHHGWQWSFWVQVSHVPNPPTDISEYLRLNAEPLAPDNLLHSDHNHPLPSPIANPPNSPDAPLRPPFARLARNSLIDRISNHINPRIFVPYFLPHPLVLALRMGPLGGFGIGFWVVCGRRKKGWGRSCCQPKESTKST